MMTLKAKLAQDQAKHEADVRASEDTSVELQRRAIDIEQREGRVSELDAKVQLEQADARKESKAAKAELKQVRARRPQISAYGACLPTPGQ